jgi:hypothetical protein
MSVYQTFQRVSQALVLIHQFPAPGTRTPNATGTVRRAALR